MKRIVVAAAALLVAAPAFADLTLHKINKTYRAYYAYNPGTGMIERQANPDNLRFGPDILWCTTGSTGYFSAMSASEGWLNWGDVDGEVNGFEFTYFLNDGNPIDAEMWFYENSNGFADPDHAPQAAFSIVDLPGSPDPNGPCCSGWIITIDLEPNNFEFTLASNDEDGDGLGDFGYVHHFPNGQDPNIDELLGPGLTYPWCEGEVGDPNDPTTWTATGSENAFDVYDPFDPNDPTGNNQGTFWFGGDPFANMWMLLYTSGAGCPNEGCDLGDLDGDCDVDLTDLGSLLAEFGTTYDLEDLSNLLTQFGNDCN